MSKKDDTNKKLVEQYLTEHSLEKILNAVINQCVKDRPQDPFVMMATLLKEHSSAKIGVLSVCGREVLDSSGQPTVEVTVTTQQGEFSACVPSSNGSGSGAKSSSQDETKNAATTKSVAAVHLRDGDDTRYNGMGVTQAVKAVNELIAPVLIGMVPQDQNKIDAALVDIDGTGNMSKIGANAALAVSIACARAGAMEKGVGLYRHLADLAELRDVCLPVPTFSLIAGGAQCGNKLTFRDFSIMPIGVSSFKEAVRCGVEIATKLQESVREQFGWSAADTYSLEGALCPDLDSSETAIDLIVAAILAAGYTTEDVKLCLCIDGNHFVVKPPSMGDDAAAAEAAIAAEAAVAESGEKEDDDDDEEEEGSKTREVPVKDYNLTPHLDAEDKDAKIVNGDALREEYRALCEKYPDMIVSLEDPFDRTDTASFKRLTEEMGENVQIAGDRLLSSHGPSIIAAQSQSQCNAIVMRPSDIGTVSDAIRTCKMAQETGWGVIVAHNTGDTEDQFLADLVVGCCSGQLKCGAVTRSERTSKLNRLIRIEEDCELAGTDCPYTGRRYRFPVG